MNNNASHWIVIRRIAASDEELRGRVSAAEWEYAVRCLSGLRRRAWLSWRAVARERLGMETAIGYDGNGAPVVETGCIGVSHDADYVAVIYDRQARCAIDVERTDRSFVRAESKYLSAAERRAAACGHPLFRAAAWCAKEALYKYGGASGVDFSEDIGVEAFDPCRMRIEGRLPDGRRVTVRLAMADEKNLIAYICDFRTEKFE